MVEVKSVDTSSIGPKWPPQETSFERVKGFYDLNVVTADMELAEILDTVLVLATELKDQQARVSIRAVVNNSLLKAANPLLSRFGEAVIPLSGTQDRLADSSILYLGCNGLERQSDPEDLERCFSNLRVALGKVPHFAAETIDKAINQGYHLQILNNHQRIGNQLVLDQMFGLYERFGWSKDDVACILANGNNLVAVASIGEKIVSAGIAETSRIDIKSRNGSEPFTLRIVEMSEAATLQEYAGKGLYSAVSSRLLVEIHSLSELQEIEDGRVDIVFGECNGHSIGVLCAARHQYRTFTAQLAFDLGLPFPGFLPQHVPIAGEPRLTKYNDLFPAFLSRVDLARFISK